MARTVYTTTISLPKELAKETQLMAKEEGKTFSEFVRQAIRLYQIQHAHRNQVSWDQLNKKLQVIRKSGRRFDSTEFLIKDRLSH